MPRMVEIHPFSVASPLLARSVFAIRLSTPPTSPRVSELARAFDAARRSTTTLDIRMDFIASLGTASDDMFRAARLAEDWCTVMPDQRARDTPENRRVAMAARCVALHASST